MIVAGGVAVAPSDVTGGVDAIGICVDRPGHINRGEAPYTQKESASVTIFCIRRALGGHVVSSAGADGRGTRVALVVPLTPG